MPSLFDTLHKNEPNPLDNIEDVLHANDWEFDRVGNNELYVNVSGRFCSYSIIFLWQADMKALQTSIHYDFTIKPTNMSKAAEMLLTINARTWMGHFEISEETKVPNYRYTSIFHSAFKSAYDDLENIIDIGLAQCETNYAALFLLTEENAISAETLPLALMKTEGVS